MTDYKPLLVVKMPVGKMIASAMRKEMQSCREGMVESFGDQYNIAIVGTYKEEWEFEGLFADPSQAKSIREQAEEKTKEIMESLKTGK